MNTQKLALEPVCTIRSAAGGTKGGKVMGVRE